MERGACAGNECSNVGQVLAQLSLWAGAAGAHPAPAAQAVPANMGAASHTALAGMGRTPQSSSDTSSL